MKSPTEEAEPLPLDKLVSRWRMALGPEGSATHAGSVQVPADDLRRLVEALDQSARPAFIVDRADLDDLAGWEERFKLFLPVIFDDPLSFHEEGEKAHIKRKLGVIDMGTHIAEALFEERSDGEIVIAFVAGMKEKRRG